MKMLQVVSNRTPELALPKELLIVGLISSYLDKLHFFLSVACSPFILTKEVGRCGEMSQANVKCTTADCSSREIGSVFMELYICLLECWNSKLPYFAYSFGQVQQKVNPEGIRCYER